MEIKSVKNDNICIQIIGAFFKDQSNYSFNVNNECDTDNSWSKIYIYIFGYEKYIYITIFLKLL